MGNVKPSFIKKLAKELLKRYPGEFTEDFEKNKKLVERLTTRYTKNVRNRIAGYISRMMEKSKPAENEQAS
ncbi:MAG: 30S ribosomal protein S17e [Thermoplasmata archaeon]|nr:MAG: 30S ribosomal protein S17e [Thermoplasmata archaeon]RLF33100.1 MAG: 30S ribosomal protein S17e [Thermoplasmata archaeon]RLF41357.1 MAG: 30S ribosomal protein S17e [Thermoplasmata archaeon]HDN51222.1 30S ribosomal protein S17e [Thermoplasmatales archaeon]